VTEDFRGVLCKYGDIYIQTRHFTLTIHSHWLLYSTLATSV